MSISRYFGKFESLMQSDMLRKYILGIFIIQSLFLAFATQTGVPPDETNHIEFIQYYANYSPGPIFNDQQPTWSLGDKTREVDYLYHYVMSWVVRILPFSNELELTIVRILSVVIASTTFVLLVRLWKRIGLKNIHINIALIAITNIPMVLMMSSSINNDVLVWLGAVASALLLIRLKDSYQPTDVLLLLSIATYGGLVKRTLLPLCLVVGLLTVALAINYWSRIKENINWPNWWLVIYCIVLLVGVGLFAERVGGNIYQYRSVSPSCEEVQGDVACKVFWSSVRKVWLNNDDLTKTNGWLAGGAQKEVDILPVPIFVVSWWFSSFNNIVDIQTQGWRHETMPPVWLGPTLGALLISTIGIGVIGDVRLFKKNRLARERIGLIILMLIIISSLCVVNYMLYREYHVFGLALNGRYLLPALLPLVGLGVFYASTWFSLSLRRLSVILLLTSIIAGSGLIVMIRNTQLFTG